MRDYTKYDIWNDGNIWNDGIEISIKIYELTKNFPEEEKFGLTSQIRRTSISISSNFAEGCSRTSEKDFKRFIEIALGSIFELKTQLTIANKLKFIQSKELEDKLELIHKCGKQLNTLRYKLK